MSSALISIHTHDISADEDINRYLDEDEDELRELLELDEDDEELDELL